MTIVLGALLLIGLTIGMLVVMWIFIVFARWLENLLDRHAEDAYWRRKNRAR